jgi:4-hydroxyacetophenone monooxygenase
LPFCENTSDSVATTLGGEQSAIGLDPDRLESALRDANVPALLAVLAYTTNDDTWLVPPFLPTRTRGLSDHATGGLSPEVQDKVRSAVLNLVMNPGRHRRRTGDVGDERLAQIMSMCMGEEVPIDYVPMMREEMGLQPRFEPAQYNTVPERSAYSVVIVGAGASGLCMAMQLKQADIPFTIIEKDSDLGGTWYENRYPDAGVDTPSYWYSYSFSPTNWSRYYSKRDDVHDYLVRTAKDFGILEHIIFDTKVETARFDETDSCWDVTTNGVHGQRKLRAAFLITAVGQLNQPKTPHFTGVETFLGEQFHSAAWPEGLDLTDKSVGVIGTGASAMQLVPAITNRARRVTVFQRSPQWIAPNAEYTREVSDDTRYIMENVPYYASWYRMRQVWAFGDKIFDSLIRDPSWANDDTSINAVNDGYRRYFTNYVKEQLDSRPDLLEKSLPSYPPFGKRMLLDSGWFTALKQANVHLETSAVESIDSHGAKCADGAYYDLDVIIYATGFDSLNMLSSIDVTGREGRSLRSHWGDDDARAYLGVTERGFPNMFFLYGPNTNLGHGGSLLFIAECQVRYILDLITQMMSRGAREVECRQEVRDRYNAEVDAAHTKLIWTHPGMTTWYRNSAGRVVTNSPWRLLDVWRMLRVAELDDYDLRGNWHSAPESDTQLVD